MGGFLVHLEDDSTDIDVDLQRQLDSGFRVQASGSRVASGPRVE